MSTKKQIAPSGPIYESLRYSLSEANAILRQSPAKTFNDIRDGKLLVIKDGRRTYVPGTELIRRSRLPEQSAA